MHLHHRPSDVSQTEPYAKDKLSHLALEESDFAVALLEPQGRIVFANPKLEELWEAAPHSLLGRLIQERLVPPASSSARGAEPPKAEEGGNVALPWGLSSSWGLRTSSSSVLAVDLLRLGLVEEPKASLLVILPTPWPYELEKRLASLAFALHSKTNHAFFKSLTERLASGFGADRVLVGQCIQEACQQIRVYCFQPEASLSPQTLHITRDIEQHPFAEIVQTHPACPLWLSLAPRPHPSFCIPEPGAAPAKHSLLCLLGETPSSLSSSEFAGFVHVSSSSALLHPLELALFLSSSTDRLLGESDKMMRDSLSSHQRTRARILLDLFSAHAYESLFDGSHVTISWLSDNCPALLGYSNRELMSQATWEKIIHEDDKPLIHKFNSSLLALGSADTEFRMITRSGEIRWFHLHARTIESEDEPGLLRVIGASRDVTQEKKLLEELRYERRVHRLITEHASDLIALHSLEGRFEYVSPSCERLLGYSCDELQDRNLYELFFHPDERNLLWRTREQLERKENVSLLSRFRHRDGRYLWFESTLVPILDSTGLIVGIQSISRNVTRRKETEERLHKSIKEIEYLNQHDLLTGLPNHILFQDRLEQAILQARRERLMTAVVCFDLDRFHRVNDLLGHSRASQLLYALSERLRTYLRPGDSLARMGGNEFMILLPSVLDEQIAVRLAQTLLQSLEEEPFEIDGHEIFLNASVGISLFPSDSDDSETLIRHSYSAMRRAKQEGSGHFRLYAPAMHVAANERLTIESSLRRALERQQLAVYYQPQVCVINELLIPFASQNTLHSAPASTHYVIDGMEALLRWKHPDLGLISPARFIPVAEDLGLIVSMGEWIMRQACLQNKAWQNAGMPKVPVSVNLSPWQFRRPNLIQTIESVLTESNLDPKYLELEITENIFMRDEAEISDRMRKIQQMGVQIAIDDFGTGYSSLSYLKRFPIHILKIDQSFIKDVTNNPNDTALTKGIIALAHNLDLRVVAEGVHSYNQLHYLRSLKCDRLQGYLFSPPVAGEEFEKILRLRTILPREVGN